MGWPGVHHFSASRGPEHRDGGQLVHQSAGQQHHQQQQLEQHQPKHDIQRTSAGQHTTAQRDRSELHGRGTRLLPDRYQRLRFVQLDWHWRRDLPARRAVRAAQAGQDPQRLWLEGGRCGRPLPRQPGVHGYGDGGNAVSLPGCNRQASHDLVAAKPFNEARL